MPTRFTFYRWMCDMCEEMYEHEHDCVLHERRIHPGSTQQAKYAGDLDALKQICERIDVVNPKNNYGEWTMYENLCQTIIDKVGDMKRQSVTAMRTPHRQHRAPPSVVVNADCTQDDISATMETPTELMRSRKQSKPKRQLTPQPCAEPESPPFDATMPMSADESKPKYECEQCGKAFSCRAHVRRHVEAVHEKLRKYKCTVCDHAFARHEHLTKHLQTRHYNDPDLFQMYPQTNVTKCDTASPTFELASEDANSAVAGKQRKRTKLSSD